MKATSPNHPLVLASASPRRKLLLGEAGFDPRIMESDIDDGGLPRGAVSPECFVMALAWFKVARVRYCGAPDGAILIGADTVCVHESELLGKPRDEADAAEMLRAMRDRSHRVVTGVAVLPVSDRPAEDVSHRRIFVDAAVVRLGRLPDEAIDAYVASGDWKGKAGGYNYSERLQAGWPVSCAGDPTGVMGLPMRRVVPLLDRLGAARRVDARPSAPRSALGGTA